MGQRLRFIESFSKVTIQVSYTLDNFFGLQVVPASLAYGDRGAGEVIPPGSTLLFDIVVVAVEKVGSQLPFVSVLKQH